MHVFYKFGYLIVAVSVLLSSFQVIAEDKGADTLRAIPEHLEIEGPFENGSDVTDTCLQCHEQSAEDFMQTRHWTWSSKQHVYNKGWIDTGKKHAINNFCYGVASNLSRCTECHAGYGWKDESFDFSDPVNIDCLVCHDRTGTYKRLAGDGGVAHPATNFEQVARNVGKPGRENCGHCHFHGGGAHGVKHGDLEKELINTTQDIDVHMAIGGLNFDCQKCHVAKQHKIRGTTMSASPAGIDKVSCIDCHKPDLHKLDAYNHHAKSIACQTCHIPYFAKVQPTKIYWDWSQAGNKQKKEYDEQGMTSYDPDKGKFIWEKDIMPEYAWFNGVSGVHAWGDKLKPGEPLKLNWPISDKRDLKAKIYPFKIHRGKQIYDSHYNYMINPQLFGSDGFVYTHDWNKTAEQGMKARGLEYSGEYDFTDTLMYLRINHMVAPAKQALNCRDCHGREIKRFDWKKLGYDADPIYEQGQARYPVSR